MRASLLGLCLLFWPLPAHAGDIGELLMGEPEKSAAARLIFRNECAGRVACLTSWNEGEHFASLGIGHFIWYPASVPVDQRRFSESFPALLRFLRHQGVRPPAWLDELRGCPWPDRDAFLAARDGWRMRELRDWLAASMPAQADFMARRLQRALPLMLRAAPPARRPLVRRHFGLVAASPMGMYVLMDYVNFKGEGVNPKERYAGEGWGLLQVLAAMPDAEPGVDAVRAFAAAAAALLERRVAHAPSERHEARWLPGWKKRLAGYVREAERAIR